MHVGVYIGVFVFVWWPLFGVYCSPLSHPFAQPRHNHEQIRPYGDIFAYLSQAVAAGKRVWLDPDKSNYALVQAASGARGQDVEVPSPDGGSTPVVEQSAQSLLSKPSPVTLWKALKNPVELEGMRAAHLRDGK